MATVLYTDGSGEICGKWNECDLCGKRAAWESFCYGPENWGIVFDVRKDDRMVDVIVNDPNGKMREISDSLIQFAWIQPRAGDTYCPKCLDELGI